MKPALLNFYGEVYDLLISIHESLLFDSSKRYLGDLTPLNVCRPHFATTLATLADRLAQLMGTSHLPPETQNRVLVPLEHHLANLREALRIGPYSRVGELRTVKDYRFFRDGITKFVMHPEIGEHVLTLRTDL